MINMATKLKWVRLQCSCGTRYDLKNSLTDPNTKKVMQSFNAKDFDELKQKYICKRCIRTGSAPVERKFAFSQPVAKVSNIPVKPINEDIRWESRDINFLIPNYEERYIPRRIRGIQDVTVIEKAIKYNIANSGKVPELYNILLIGDTGVGKSHCARFMAWKLKLPYKRINLNGATTPEDLVGQFVPSGERDKPFVWVDGWLTKFMRHGGILVLDEINMAQADILAILNSVLDRERSLVLTHKDGEIIQAHKNFIVISTMNLHYEGTKPLNEALRDRFNLTLEFNYDSNVEKELISNKNILDFAEKLRIAYLNSELMTPVSTRSLMFFQTNLRVLGKYIAEEIFFNRFDTNERKVVRETYRMILNPKPEVKDEEADKNEV